MAWLTFTVIVAAEVQAVLQYASIYWPSLTTQASDGTHPLTLMGFIVAAGMGLWALVGWFRSR